MPTRFVVRVLPLALLPGLAACSSARVPTESVRAAADVPVVPALEPALRDRLRALHRRGLERGVRPGVFARVGDSITYSDAFLKPIGCGREELGEHARLAPVIEHFRATALPLEYGGGDCERPNAFTTQSAAADSGWTTDTVLGRADGTPAGCTLSPPTPLGCELQRLRPAVVLVMLGTNDLARDNDLARYRRNLARIVTAIEESGAVPVLSTIPPRTDDPRFTPRVGEYNAVVVEVARDARVPVWNYHRAMAAPGMVNQGLDADGVHPSVYGNCEPPIGCAAVTFSAEGLRYGYNVRNLTALQVLDVVWREVLGGGGG